MKEIIIKPSGKIILVDDEDYERLNQFNWVDGNTIRRCISIKHKWRRRITTASVCIANEVMQCFDGTMYDHKDRNAYNNQKDNLRICTHQENMMNKLKLKNTTSKYKGVSWHKASNKWCAFITKNYKSIYLGCYKIEEDAARAYNEAATKHFGEFANLNQFL